MIYFFDNIVFDLQKSGGISVVWYELLRRISQDHDFCIRYIDNRGNTNPYRRKLDIQNNMILKGDSCITVSRYLPVSVKGHRLDYIGKQHLDRHIIFVYVG